MVPAMDAASETSVHIQELVRKATERVEADLSTIGTKIHRCPRGLRMIGGYSGERYVIPSFVALGPYHRGLSHLQEMEEVKHAAAHYFCRKWGQSVEEVYCRILCIAGEARSCYADDAVACFSDAEFAAMMFVDGCFLLQYLSGDVESALLQNRMILSAGPGMASDIILLENQLPWLVLEALMVFSDVDVYQVVASFDMGIKFSKRELPLDEFRRHRPHHLLGLFYYYQIGSIPPDELRYKPQDNINGAIELAEIGIKLTASNNSWFGDMTVQKGILFGKLSLTPLFLNDTNACWLVNMAAFEACTSTSYLSAGYTIGSYLSFVAMLIDKEEDVHELRAKHLLRSFFSNRDTLYFYKDLAGQLRLGHRYFAILAKIDEYKCERPVRIAVHKFLYNNYKTIATLFSIAGVLVGIFKSLMSLKQR